MEPSLSCDPELYIGGRQAEQASEQHPPWPLHASAPASPLPPEADCDLGYVSHVALTKAASEVTPHMLSTVGLFLAWHRECRCTPPHPASLFLLNLTFYIFHSKIMLDQNNHHEIKHRTKAMLAFLLLLLSMHHS